MILQIWYSDIHTFFSSSFSLSLLFCKLIFCALAFQKESYNIDMGTLNVLSLFAQPLHAKTANRTKSAEIIFRVWINLVENSFIALSHAKKEERNVRRRCLFPHVHTFHVSLPSKTLFLSCLCCGKKEIAFYFCDLQNGSQRKNFYISSYSSSFSAMGY